MGGWGGAVLKSRARRCAAENDQMASALFPCTRGLVSSWGSRRNEFFFVMCEFTAWLFRLSNGASKILSTAPPQKKKGKKKRQEAEHTKRMSIMCEGVFSGFRCLCGGGEEENRNVAHSKKRAKTRMNVRDSKKGGDVMMREDDYRKRMKSSALETRAGCFCEG